MEMSDTTETPTASRTTMSKFMIGGRPGLGKMRPKTSNQLQSSQQIADFNQYLQQSYGDASRANNQFHANRGSQITKIVTQTNGEQTQTDKRQSVVDTSECKRHSIATGQQASAVNN